MFKMTFKKQAWIMLLGSITISALLFLVANVSYLRFDFTEDQVYSLSDSTRNILKQVEEPIMIRAYLTPDLPQPYGRLSRFVEDMLHAYHQAGSNHVGFEIINPDSDPNTATSLSMMGIPKVQVQVIEDDRAQTKQGYLAVVIEYLDQKEVIQVVQSEAGFEYALTSHIKRLTHVGKKKVGIVPAYGAPSLSELQALKDVVAADYELVEVHPEEKNIPDDIDALIIPGFTSAPSQKMRYALDQFRLQNKGMMILAGQVRAKLEQGFVVQPVPNDTNVWLKDYGMALESGLVMDMQALRIRVNQRQGRIAFQTMVDYPLIPQVIDLNPQHILSQGLESVNLPFASPLTWYNDTKGVVLLHSSENSAVQNGPPFDINPLVAIPQRFAGLRLTKSALVQCVEGKANSAFSENISNNPEHVHKNQAGATRVLLVGSLSLLDDQFIDGENALFILNALDWLTHDEALIHLRSSGITQRPLTHLDSDVRAIWKATWIFALPLLLLLMGIWRWRTLKS